MDYTRIAKEKFVEVKNTIGNHKRNYQDYKGNYQKKKKGQEIEKKLD